MIQATLKRWAYTSHEILGKFLILDQIYYTLEQPWHDNERGKSAIPLGAYICKRFHSAHYPNTFELQNVPNRDGILIHWGNSAHDTQGCILLGFEIGSLNNSLAVLQSQKAFNRFITSLSGIDSFMLNIIDSDIIKRE